MIRNGFRNFSTTMSGFSLRKRDFCHKKHALAMKYLDFVVETSCKKQKLMHHDDDSDTNFTRA